MPETDSVIIGGAFNNFPSVVIWFRSNSTVRPLNDGSILSGDVAALALVIAALFVFQAYSYASLYASFAQMEIEPAASRRKKNSNNSSFGISRLFFALSAAVILFAVMGIAFLVGFKTKIEYESIMNEADTNEDNDYAVDIDLTSISLDALTGGIKSKIDIEICFENAMRSRHVKFRESLRSINSNLINLTRIIGEGSYGRVWAGRWRNEPVAVKEFVFAQTALLGGSLQTSELIEEIIGEAGIMSLLRHPKILQLYGVSLTTQTIWIISELCSCGSLRMILSNKRMELSFMTRLSIALDIAEGLNYLHTRRPQIIHRDLKVQ